MARLKYLTLRRAAVAQNVFSDRQNLLYGLR